MYPNINTGDFNKKLNSHREFSILHETHKSSEEYDLHYDKLRLFNYQQFDVNYLNENTPYKILVLMYEMGSGKTLVAVKMAMNAINLIKSRISQTPVPKYSTSSSVFVIGFSQKIFERELFRFPEFGYVSGNEYCRYKEYIEQAQTTGNPEFEAQVKTMLNKFRRRLKNRTRRGFFKFYGYRQFTNALFETELDMSQLSEEQIEQSIGSGLIRVNTELLDEFHGSLMICDEIHNTYNLSQNNNWGIAIKYVLDNVSSVRAVFMSGTPVSNSPREIVSFIRLVSGTDQSYDNICKQIFTQSGQLKPHADVAITSYLSGRVSFLRDYANIDLYPRRVFKGERVHGIKYLKFTSPPLTKFQQRFVDKVPLADCSILYDIAIPTPNGDGVVANRAQLFEYYTDPTPLVRIMNNSYVAGDITTAENLRKYSGKYSKMLEIIATSAGKIFIYHKRVGMTGTYFIAEILKSYGYIEWGGVASMSTRCSVCNATLEKHADITSHQFIATTYILIHGELDKITVENYINNFNSDKNTEGHYIKTVVGSDAIKEGYDFKSIRTMMVMSPPDSIQEYRQITARAIRKNSHKQLATELALVDIYTFATGYELNRYKKKMADYEVIKVIEHILANTAINTPIVTKTIQTYKPTIDPFDGVVVTSSKSGTIVNNTYNAFYHDWETQQIIMIIFAIMIKYQTVEFNRMWNLVVDPPINTEFNPQLLTKDGFYITIQRLLEHTTHRIPAFDDGNKKYSLYLVDEYLTIVPFEQMLYPELSHKIHVEPAREISIGAFLTSSGMERNYKQKRDKFIAHYSGLEFDKFDTIICSYEQRFHQLFLEEVITDIYTYITRGTRNANTDFYLKMLAYYKLVGIVLFANANILQNESYTVSAPEPLAKASCAPRNSNDPLVNEFIQQTQSSELMWCPGVARKSLGVFIGAINKYVTSGRCKAPPSNLLPVGHMVLEVPRIYFNTKWRTAPEFYINKTYVENNIIIGYYEKSRSSITYKFKLRSPIQNIKRFQDQRLTERGYVCSTHSKLGIIAIAKKLGLPSGGSITKLCEAIRVDLICKEISERTKGTNIKWFYHFYENQPELY